jgi:hypothetical protein
LTTVNAIITQADKGKTIVIINSNEYSEKVYSFLNADNFNIVRKDLTEKFHNLIHKTMLESNLIIDKKQIKLLTQKKALPPTLNAQLKLRKIDIPIHPVINNRTAPAYELARYLTTTLDQNISLNNYFNVTNSTNLANELMKLEKQENHRMISFDIKDLYVNIPIDETLNIIKTKLLQNNNIQITYQMLSLLKVILSQNYFMFQQKIYQPAQGISMGSPISSLIAETFLQHYEDVNIKQLLDMKNIALYV